MASTRITRSLSALLLKRHRNRAAPSTRLHDLGDSIAPSSSSSSAAVSLNHHHHQSRRHMGTGPRGQRGHGWYINYRAGKGGRHLQGEFSDRPSLEESMQWNRAVMSLGSTRVTLQVVVEPRDQNTPADKRFFTVPDLDSLQSSQTFPLELDVSTAVMTQTSDNFTALCLDQFKGSRFYRFERNLGICGGDYLTNWGRTGQAARHGVPLAMDVTDDPLALWHVNGAVTMLVQKVGTIDSRFMLLTENAPHMDGIHRAFGMMTPESVEQVRRWQNELLTRNGVPTSYDLIITDASVNTTSAATETNSGDSGTSGAKKDDTREEAA